MARRRRAMRRRIGVELTATPARAHYSEPLAYSLEAVNCPFRVSVRLFTTSTHCDVPLIDAWPPTVPPCVPDIVPNRNRIDRPSIVPCVIVSPVITRLVRVPALVAQVSVAVPICTPENVVRPCVIENLIDTGVHVTAWPSETPARLV